MKTLRILVLVSALAALLHAKSFRMRTRSAGSLRARLISAGKYAPYLEQQRIRALQILSKGFQPFLDYADDFYLGEVQVGTPGQNITLVLDTGSSNMWVIDETCKSSACNGKTESGYSKTKFKTKESKTFKKESRTFSLTYGSGSCEGYLATDAVSFAGISIAKQEFGVATKIAEVFGYQPVDGILGLGWPDLATEKVVPPMQNILSQLDKPVFTVWMDRKIKPSKGGSGGLITYGDLDNENCAPDVNYVKLSSLTYWQFPIEGFTLGKFTRSKTEQVISDTGTSWIGVPRNVLASTAKELNAEVDQENQLLTVPCSTMWTNPDLTFTISGIKYSVPSVQYILDLELGNDKCALTFFGMDSGGFGPAWILGDTWIRTYCNVHDIGGKRIGFSKAIHADLHQ